ncbi:hypothetical protein GRI62_00250 [Erythrobacter arachoides]|uniref:DUF2505 domain-containing protein n=1 Tax=Aurantiacibacter arachoides TaxID=1850444 RepID=A0A844ZVX5_9SPHN|nr:hypothetical protein [Aurantiacibacter arachoides]MXO92035.1 hypothetical protein [Aurantiacibacter arachoides]GGD60256.1 hypothetical protein GCM10011411_20550 [Aurantiacibacter arachoides]
MFGLFRNRQPVPDGPIIVSHSTIIDCHPELLYRTVDFGDERCWKKEVGSVARTGPDSFVMTLDMAPDLVFPVRVLEALPEEAYTYECTIEPKVGRLVKSTERYDMSAEGDATHVTLTMLAEMDAGMSRRERAQEMKMLGVAGGNALAKLKIHVEQGVRMIREIEALQ